MKVCDRRISRTVGNGSLRNNNDITMLNAFVFLLELKTKVTPRGGNYIGPAVGRITLCSPVLGGIMDYGCIAYTLRNIICINYTKLCYFYLMLSHATNVLLQVKP